MQWIWEHAEHFYFWEYLYGKRNMHVFVYSVYRIYKLYHLKSGVNVFVNFIKIWVDLKSTWQLLGRVWPPWLWWAPVGVWEALGSWVSGRRGRYAVVQSAAGWACELVTTDSWGFCSVPAGCLHPALSFALVWFVATNVFVLFGVSCSGVFWGLSTSVTSGCFASCWNSCFLSSSNILSASWFSSWSQTAETEVRGN